MRLRKTMDRWDIETNYGYGWEVECSEYAWKDAKAQANCYRENSYGKFAVRLTKHREKITRLYYYGAEKHRSGLPVCPDNYAGWSNDKAGKYQAVVAYGRMLEEREVIEYGLEFIREAEAA